MNVDKKLSGEYDRVLLTKLLEYVSDYTMNRKIDIKESIAEMTQIDVSALNNFLAGRSNSLTPKVWNKPSSNDFHYLDAKKCSEENFKELFEKFNISSKIRFMALPFSFAISKEAKEAEEREAKIATTKAKTAAEADDAKKMATLISTMVEWSIETINGIWDGTGGAVDVGYWAKLIELFPVRLLGDSEYFISLFYEKDTVQQMIEKLEEQTTLIKNIPRKMLREFMVLEELVDKYSKKSPAPNGTSQRLIQELEKQGTSTMRLKSFADCSPIFRLYSIRTVDIHLYSLIYCLPKEEQEKAKNEIADVATVCKQMRANPRKPDMELTKQKERQPKN